MALFAESLEARSREWRCSWALLQLHQSDRQFYCLLIGSYTRGFTVCHLTSPGIPTSGTGQSCNHFISTTRGAIITLCHNLLHNALYDIKLLWEYKHEIYLKISAKCELFCLNLNLNHEISVLVTVKLMAGYVRKVPFFNVTNTM